MPTAYACPANVTVTVDHPVHVVRVSADAECFVRVDASACHPGATCTPASASRAHHAASPDASPGSVSHTV